MSLLHQLFPRARAEILRVLFADADREVHVRDLERRSGLSVKTVQTELAKLAHTDLVTSRRDGNRRYYRANASHPLFVDLRQIVLKTAGLRDVLAEAFADIDGIAVAFLFGSLARDAADASSDVDLMVIGDVGLRALAPRLRKAADALGREINPITMTAAAFVRDRDKSPLLIDVMGREKLFVKGGPDELGRLG